MAGYVARRLMQSIFVVWGAVTVTFLVVRLVPGDPAALLLGPFSTDTERAALRAQLGLDRPFLLQYASYLIDVLKLDFGRSFRLDAEAMPHVLATFPATCTLAVGAMFVTLLLSFPMGIVAARRPHGLVDQMISTASLVGQSLPQFWVGIMLILIFAAGLGLFPSSGAGSLHSLVLPAFALALPYVGWLARLVRAGLLEELSADYVRTARAKGLSERVVFSSHALRNALVPVVTAAALVLGTFLGGAVIVEVVFAWPGVGKLLIDSISFRDYAVVQAAVVLIAVVYAGLNLIVDLLYGSLDPRIRLAGD
ncbi:MAG: ABC transporter permease [Streptomyces sp.]|uniref:ABC transporter permease n=1 Tax=Streptomyces sp. TaxID=1931 RepID=UPI003D6B3476